MLSFSLLAGAFLCLSIEQRFACSRFFRTDVSSSQHSLNNLATLYHDMKNHENAVQFYKDAVQMYQQLGLEHPDVARSLNNLATLYCDQGKYEEAEPLYQQALEIRKRYLGLDHPDTALSLLCLAHFYETQRKYEKAASLYRQILTTAQMSLGEQSLIQNIQEKYTTLLQHIEEFKQAEEGCVAKNLRRMLRT